MSISGGIYSVPGTTASVPTSESAVIGKDLLDDKILATIVSTTTDSGSSPTTLLRGGLLLGKITSSGKLTAYSATAVDGSQIAYAILDLSSGLSMLDVNGTAEDKIVGVLYKGFVKASAIINLDARARQQLANRFVFDDAIAASPLPCLVNQLRATDLTITAASYPAGTRFSTRGASGAVTFTLPAIAQGLWYEFYNEVDQTMTITAPAAIMIGLNNLTVTSAAFSTGGQKIGAGLRVVVNDNASKWQMTLISGGVCAVSLS